MRRLFLALLFIPLCSFAARSQATYFDIETDPDYRCNWAQYAPTLRDADWGTYDENMINTVFKDIVTNAGIEFGYPQGGCQQRAQMMSLLLDKKYHIQHGRIWLFAPVNLVFGDNRKLFITDPNSMSPGNRIEWNYHVAPVVRVIRGGQKVTLVIDPSIERSKPLTLNEWFGRIGNSNVAKYTLLKKDKYFFNRKFDGSGNLSDVINGCFYDWVNPAKDNLLLEKGLAVNDVAMAMFNKYIHPLLQSSATVDVEKANDLKAIFGNATVADLVLAQNSSGSADNTTLRYFIMKYPRIFAEARQLFTQRLERWTNMTTAL